MHEQPCHEEDRDPYQKRDDVCGADPETAFQFFLHFRALCAVHFYRFYESKIPLKATAGQ
jgi:hypothetical protein